VKWTEASIRFDSFEYTASAMLTLVTLSLRLNIIQFQEQYIYIYIHIYIHIGNYFLQIPNTTSRWLMN